MTIIYATGQPRFFEFGAASSRQQLPAGAMVLAVVDGQAATDHLDEGTFERMSDEEYYELQGLINEARQHESARKAGLLSRFRGWFTAAL